VEARFYEAIPPDPDAFEEALNRQASYRAAFARATPKAPVIIEHVQPRRRQAVKHACVRRKRSGKTADMRIRPRLAPVSRSAFAGFRFPPDVIVLAVRWYLRFGLSYRDVEELLTERGIKVDHVTIYRWVQRFTPLMAEAARPCRHTVGDRWWVDETYMKVAGRWCYAYRAIDQFGQVIDVFVSPHRDVKAARRFFQQAIGTTKATPVEVVIDLAATYPVLLEELLPAAWHRTEQ